MNTSTNTHDIPPRTPEQKVKNDADAMVEFWKAQYDRDKKAFEHETSHYGYLAAADRFRQVLRSEAMLDSLGGVAYDAGTPEATQRLRDRREQYVAQILRAVGGGANETVMIRIRALREVVDRIDALLRKPRLPLSES
jgi:hypothetical protein